MTLRTVARNRTLIQVASTWGSWTTIEGAWAENSADGFCNDLGRASIIYPYGNIKRQGSASVLTYEEEAFAGRYVRIGEEDPSGLIVAADGTKFTAYWVGVAGESEIAVNAAGTGYEQRCECQGILSVLDQITPSRHWGVPQGGPPNPAADIGVNVTFNMLGNRKTGNRSADKYDFGGGYSAYVFDLSGGGEEWTARDIVEYAIAIAYLESPGGPTFSIGGQLAAAAFKDKQNLANCSCLEMITSMLSPRQGVGFRAAYNGSTGVLIDIMSLSKDAVTVTGGTDVPASDRQFTLDLTPSGVASTFSIKESQQAAYDNIRVTIAPPQYTATFSLADFEPDWTPTEQSEFDALDEDDDARSQGAMKKVYRRFKLKADWVGTPTSGFTLPTTRVTEVSALHGDGGWTGEQSTGAEYPAGMTFKLMRRLPLPSGYDWSTAVTDPDRSRSDMEPMAFVRNPPTGKYMTLAEYCDVDDVSINVEEDGTAFSIGPDKIAERIADLLLLGDELFITLGLESNMNCVCSWVRADGDLVRDKRRTISKTREKLRRRFLTPGTFIGCSDGVLKQSPGSMTTVEDDLPLAKTLMASMVSWYSISEWLLSRTILGDVVLPDDFVTGDMITEASFQDVNGDTVIVPALGVITSIVRDYTGDGRVTLSTKRISIDVEAVS